MGTAITKPATIVVQLDSDQEHGGVVAGTLLRGKIYLDVRAATVDCASLQLVVEGSEHTAVHYTTHSGTGKNRKTHHHVARSTSNFWIVNVPLKEYPLGSAEKGNYEFPFECQVPATAPSSVSVGSAGSSNSSCRVQYTVKACLHRPGWLKWDVTSTKAFPVQAAPAPVQYSPLYLEPSFVAVKTCFCYSRGRMLTGGSSPNSVLAAGETFRVNYAVQNKSTAKILAVEIALYETIRWHAQRHSASHRRTLFQRKLSALPTNNETNLPDTALLVTDKASASAVSPDEDFLQLREIKRLLDSGEFGLDIPVVEGTRTSYAGTLMQVEHRLCITVRTAMGTANPEISHPVTIVNRHRPVLGFPPQVAVAMPMGWEPIQAAAVAPPQEEDAPSELPSYWEAVQAPMYTVPVSAYCVARAAAVDGGDGKADAQLFAPSAPPMAAAAVAGGGVEALVAALAVALDPADEVQRWMQSNSVDSMQPRDYFAVFHAINGSYHQTRVAECLSNGLKQITCASLAEACRGCNEFCRREVVEILARNASIVDKQNKQVVQQYLTVFQFMCIEQLFQ